MAQETRNAYGEKLAEIIKQNKNVVVLDADLTKSTKTNLAKEACPERHFNAGIAECNMMGMAAGLAKSGKIAFASSFAIFLAGRAFEIIRNSICYPNLNVKVCATHAGLCVGEDGASHQAIEDIAIMRALPNMKVYVPCDQYETKALLDYVLKEKGPCYIRMGRGKVDDVYNENTKFDFSKINILRKGKDIVLFATGMMVQEALKAAKEVDATVVNVCSIKPIDKEGILSMLSSHKKAYALEEHNIIGGLFSAISEVKAQSDITTPLYPIGVNDVFGQSGKASDVLDKYGLTSKHIVEKIR